uniref:Rhodopsin domain-containing protein n=1 Tax=Colletotrichum fructicola (strain Nara gc5) TaxID=1213859 RepID=L2GDG2_COLFN
MMVDTDWQFATTLQRESWILYSIALLNIITENGGSNLFPIEDYATFSPQDIQARIANSKLVLISEQCMLNLIYVLKACVLILYTRLTLNLSTRRFVRWLALYVVIGWTATQITMFSACHPFTDYWAVPPSNPQCATFETYAILQAWFNISSDMLMLMVPLPLIIRMTVSWRQKVVLVFIFSLGICVIVAAFLTKVYNLSDPYSPRYMLWYIREASVAVYVSNLPLLWPLLREWFPWLKNLKTVGVLPTPHPAVASGPRGKETNVKASTAVGERSQVGPAGWPVGTAAVMKRDTFLEFGAWIRAGDLELQKPARAKLASPSTELFLESGSETPMSSLTPEKNRKSASSASPSQNSGATIEETYVGQSTAGGVMLGPDLERGDFVWETPRGPGRVWAGAASSKFSLS